RPIWMTAVITSAMAADSVSGTLLVATGFLGSFGGVQAVERSLHLTLDRLARATGQKHVTCSLADTPAMVRRASDVDGTIVAAGGSRSRLVRKVIWHCLRARPQVVIFSHVHLGRLAPIVRMLCPWSRVITLAYGIDVWKPLDLFGRIGLRSSTAFWSISRYTARQLAHHNRVSLSRVYLLPLAIDHLPPVPSVDA